MFLVDLIRELRICVSVLVHSKDNLRITERATTTKKPRTIKSKEHIDESEEARKEMRKMLQGCTAFVGLPWIRFWRSGGRSPLLQGGEPP